MFKDRYSSVCQRLMTMFSITFLSVPSLLFPLIRTISAYGLGGSYVPPPQQTTYYYWPTNQYPVATTPFTFSQNTSPFPFPPWTQTQSPFFPPTPFPTPVTPQPPVPLPTVQPTLPIPSFLQTTGIPILPPTTPPIPVQQTTPVPQRTPPPTPATVPQSTARPQQPTPVTNFPVMPPGPGSGYGVQNTFPSPDLGTVPPRGQPKAELDVLSNSATDFLTSLSKDQLVSFFRIFFLSQIAPEANSSALMAPRSGQLLGKQAMEITADKNVAPMNLEVLKSTEVGKVLSEYAPKIHDAPKKRRSAVIREFNEVVRGLRIPKGIKSALRQAVL